MEEIAQEGNVKLMENTAYLPIGFMVNEDMLKYEVDKTVDNPIENQNEIFSYATGIDEDVFTILNVVSQGHTDYAVFPVNKTSNYKYSFSTNNSAVAPHLKYNYEMPEDGMVCFYANITNADSLTLYVNDESQGSFDISKAYVACGGVFKKGDKISLYVDLDEGASGTATVVCGYFNQDVFDEGYEILSQNTLETTSYTDSSIEGTITVDEDGLFYTSIPYEEGWRAWVDGEEVEITPVGNAMLAFSLSEGTHTVKMSFIPKGFWPGLLIFIGGVAVFIIMCLVAWITGRKRDKGLYKTFNDEQTGYPDDEQALIEAQEREERKRLEELERKRKEREERMLQEGKYYGGEENTEPAEELSETTKRVLEYEEMQAAEESKTEDGQDSIPE